jgi:hypothetical protein
MAVGKPRLVQLWTEIVVVEDESRPVKHSEEEPDRPEEIGWIAALDGHEATAQARPEAQDEGGEERIEVFQYEGDT